jgi:hypothetical protein
VANGCLTRLVGFRIYAASDRVGGPLVGTAEIEEVPAVIVTSYAHRESLLINGHNPLTLLHSALSKGLHAKTDEECLELAHDVRIVLTELAERLGQALKDEAELNTAVSRLIKSKS